MTRKNARFLILGNLLAIFFASSLFAMNAEMSCQFNAAREIAPLNLPQNSFSIDPAGNLLSDELGTTPNSDLKTVQSSRHSKEIRNLPEAQAEETPLPKGRRTSIPEFFAVTPAVRKPGSRQSWIPAFAGMTNAQYRGSTPLSKLPGKRRGKLTTLNPGFLKGDARGITANIADLSAIYDGISASSNPRSLLEPNENNSEILGAFQPQIKTIKAEKATPKNDSFDRPAGIAVDAEGLIYVSDPFNNRIQIFDFQGNYVRSIAGLHNPQDVFVDVNGLIYVADSVNNRIVIFDHAGKQQATIGASQMGTQISNITIKNTAFNFPGGVFVDVRGRIYVADTRNNRVQIFEPYPSLKYLTTLEGFHDPYGIFVDAHELIYVADSSNHRIKIFEPYPSLKYLWTIGTGEPVRSGNDGFQYPYQVYVDAEGFVYVPDSYNHRIQVFEPYPSLKYLKTIGTGKETSGNEGFNHPVDVFVDSHKNIYITDTFNERVQIFENLETWRRNRLEQATAVSKFLDPESEKQAIPEPSNKKEELARDRFKIIWDDASRFLP